MTPNPDSEPVRLGTLAIWDRLRTPPETALKKIMGGPLKGKSDINPQWRWQALTDEFGPIGEGWIWEQCERWTVDVPATGEVMLFVRVKMRYRLAPRMDGLPAADEWSEWIYGSGGSKLIEGDKNGLHGNDEALKMAETDALGNAAKYLGLAADVFMGMMDGSKYEDRQQQVPPQQQRRQPLSALAAAAGHGAPAKAESRGQPPARPTGRQVPAGMPDACCPNCGGPMWDNRNAKRYATDPDWKCKDRRCVDANGGYQGTSFWKTDAEWRAYAASQSRTIPEDDGPPIDGPPPGWDPAIDGFGDPDDVPM